MEHPVVIVSSGDNVKIIVKQSIDQPACRISSRHVWARHLNVDTSRSFRIPLQKVDAVLKRLKRIYSITNPLPELVRGYDSNIRMRNMS